MPESSLTKVHKVQWIGSSAGPEPGGSYYPSDVTRVRDQNPNPGRIGYYRGVIYNTDTHEYEEHIFVVSIDASGLMVSNSNYLVAKPCPPLCGTDGNNSDLTSTQAVLASDVP